MCGMIVGTSHHGNNTILPPVIDRQAAKERVSSCHGYLWPQVNISIDFSRNHTVMCMNKPHFWPVKGRVGCMLYIYVDSMS